MDFSITGIFEHFTPPTWTIFAVLVTMSVLSMTVAFNRGLAFRRTKVRSQRFAEAVGAHLTAGDVAPVLEVTPDKAYRFAYLARIVDAALKDAIDLKSKDDTLSDLSTVASAMERAVSAEAASIRKWMTILATVSATAPFVGLLGTVFGIINSFLGMASTGSGGLGAVAGGIAEALIMTGIGLIVAIPAVWMYNWANARADGIEREMRDAASETLDWVKKNKSAIPAGDAA